jgi:RNA polymerase sigma-70 factor (ECF subfamily)
VDSSIDPSHAPAEPRFARDAFANYRGDLHRFLLRRLRSTHDASDVMQEVFLRLLQLDRTDAVRNPQAYIYGIASHVAHEFRRRAQRYQHAEAETQDFTLEDPAEQLDLERSMEQALAELPPVQLRILLARQRDGLSYPQIGNALGLSAHTVRKYLDRALASVRSRLRRGERSRR